MEAEPACKAVILKNISRMKTSGQWAVYCGSYVSELKKCGMQDIMFLDPPYHKELGIKGLEMISEYGILSPEGIVVLEHDFTEAVPESIGSLHRYDLRKYGRVMLSFYKRNGGVSG